MTSLACQTCLSRAMRALHGTLVSKGLMGYLATFSAAAVIHFYHLLSVLHIQPADAIYRNNKGPLRNFSC